MAPHDVTMSEALDLTRTGDLWLFRGSTVADRAIRVTTNSPVNHVGMAVVLDDLPPLMWHAELGRSLPDLWSGTHQRGVQLHDLRDAVTTWARKYEQRAWLRQLGREGDGRGTPYRRGREDDGRGTPFRRGRECDGPVTREMEDAVLRTIARLDGTPFPSTVRLAGRWLRGRVPRLPGVPRRPSRGAAGGAGLEFAYCAEVVAITYTAMGLLSSERSPAWYDPGRFWSGDELELNDGYALGGEISVEVESS